MNNYERLLKMASTKDGMSELIVRIMNETLDPSGEWCKSHCIYEDCDGCPNNCPYQDDKLSVSKWLELDSES